MQAEIILQTSKYYTTKGKTSPFGVLSIVFSDNCLPEGEKRVLLLTGSSLPCLTVHTHSGAAVYNPVLI